MNKNRRDEILRKLGEAHIGVAVNYRAIHLLTYFRKKFGYKKGGFPFAEDIGDRTISLPFYVNLQSEDIKYVVSKLKAILLR